MGASASISGDKKALQKLAREYHFELSDLIAQKKRIESAVGSKWISREQLRQSLTIITTDEMVDSLARVLTGKKGAKKVSVTQYIQGLTRFCYGPPNERFEYCFKLFDYDNGGDLDKEEMEVIIDKLLSGKNGKKLSKKQRKNLSRKYFSQMDADHSGSVSFDEFKMVVARDRRLSQAILNLAKFANFEKERQKKLIELKNKKLQKRKQSTSSSLDKNTPQGSPSHPPILSQQSSAYLLNAQKRQAERMRQRKLRRMSLPRYDSDTTSIKSSTSFRRR